MDDPTNPGIDSGLAEGRPADPEANPWIIHDRTLAYTNPWIRVFHHNVTTPAGTPGVYGIVEFRNRAVGVVPVAEDGTTWLVGQYRLPLQRYSWEIPEGGAPEGQGPEEAAHRELAEETGLRARCLMELGHLDLSNSATDETAVYFVAWDLDTGEAAPEETEALTLRRVPLRDAMAMACDGRITDAISVAALLRLKLAFLEGELPDRLAACVRRGLSR